MGAMSRQPDVAGSTVDHMVELYTRYGGSVYARCRQLLGDEAAAEEATQQIFLQALRRLRAQPPLDRHGQGDHLLGWLFAQATSHCLEEVVDRQEPADEERLDDRELAARLVARLDRRVRVMAWLCHVDGMTQDEAARLLGVPRRTVVERLARLDERTLRSWRGSEE
jgi:RNA polymerase sigma-70 factor (ECF subfamily)